MKQFLKKHWIVLLLAAAVIGLGYNALTGDKKDPEKQPVYKAIDSGIAEISVGHHSTQRVWGWKFKGNFYELELQTTILDSVRKYDSLKKDSVWLKTPHFAMETSVPVPPELVLNWVSAKGKKVNP